MEVPVIDAAASPARNMASAATSSIFTNSFVGCFSRITFLITSSRGILCAAACASICLSINEEVIHGIPGEYRLQEGDILSVDVGVNKAGYFGDAAVTIPVGQISDGKRKLLETTERALYAGIEKAIHRNHVSDISRAVQNVVEGEGFSVVRDFVGHGVGKRLHEEPPIPNYKTPGRGPQLLEGMTLAIEPMVNMGGYGVYIRDDNWTVVTKDGTPSAHFEHTILVRDGEPDILTLL